jgi:hypothetical protein
MDLTRNSVHLEGVLVNSHRPRRHRAVVDGRQPPIGEARRRSTP